MKILIQRVKEASVEVDNKIVGSINRGLLVFIGFEDNDKNINIDYFIKKILKLRVFEDQNKKMNLSVKDINGEILVISQFTLYADCNKGNRPSFINAANPILAKKLYDKVIIELKKSELNIAQGIFGSDMQIKAVNDGPASFILESK